MVNFSLSLYLSYKQVQTLTQRWTKTAFFLSSWKKPLKYYEGQSFMLSSIEWFLELTIYFTIGLADENESVREAALSAGHVLVEHYATTYAFFVIFHI